MAKFFDHVGGFATNDTSSNNTNFYFQFGGKPLLKIQDPDNTGSEINYGYLITSEDSAQSINGNLHVYGLLGTTYNSKSAGITSSYGWDVSGGLHVDTITVSDIDTGTIVTNTLNERNISDIFETSSSKVKNASNADQLVGNWYCGNLQLKNTSSTSSNPIFGTCSATKFTATSDKNLKTNIQDCNKYGLDIINQLQLKTFTWKDDVKQELNFGLIAQDLLQILPSELKDFYVVKREDGYLTISESKLIYVLINAVKELQAEIVALKNKG